jgi:hypothetical protein
VIGDLDAVRAALGTVSNVSNANLERALAATKKYVRDRIYPALFDDDDTQYAIILSTIRLYKRLGSPEGVAGWSDLGVVRILGSDPDIARLLEQKRDMTKAGIA